MYFNWLWVICKQKEWIDVNSCISRCTTVLYSKETQFLGNQRKPSCLWCQQWQEMYHRKITELIFFLWSVCGMRSAHHYRVICNWSSSFIAECHALLAEWWNNVLFYMTNYISLTKVIVSETIVKWSYYLNCIFKQENPCWQV